jgi:hypothetical protein
MTCKAHLRFALLAACAAFVATSCAHETGNQTPKSGAVQRDLDARGGEREGPGGERKKKWSGLSYAAQTYVQLTPSESLATSSFDSERVWGGGDDWEPAVAADPGAPYVYQMTTRYTGSPAEIVFRRSVDGGATWEADQVFMPNSGDPMVEVADDGTVYTLGIVGNQWDLLLKRSFDHGLTWDDPPIDVIGGRGPDTWGDRPVLVISPDGQDVYVAYNRGDIYVVASHDGGATFDPEVQITNNGRQWFTSAGAVAPNGDVYFAAADYSSGYTGPTYINVLRSIDDGASWTTTLLDTSAESSDCSMVDGCYFNFLGPEIGLAIDVNGLVMISYNAGDVDLQPHKLWARTSSDGVVWSDRTEISSGIAGVNNAFPAMVASRTVPGEFRVVWQDDSEGNMTAWNTWMVTTRDGGASWSEPDLLSDLDSGAPYKGPLGYSFVYGDYFEIAIDGDDVSHIIWGAGTSYTGPGGSWYTRGIPVPEPAAWFQLLAGVMLLTALARRRSAAGVCRTRQP